MWRTETDNETIALGGTPDQLGQLGFRDFSGAGSARRRGRRAVLGTRRPDCSSRGSPTPRLDAAAPIIPEDLRPRGVEGVQTGRPSSRSTRMLSRLCSLSASKIARASSGVSTNGKEMIVFTLLPGSFTPALIAFRFGTIADERRHARPELGLDLCQRRFGIFHSVVKQTGDHDILRVTHAVEDQSDGEDVFHVRDTRASPLAVAMPVRRLTQRPREARRQGMWNELSWATSLIPPAACSSAGRRAMVANQPRDLAGDLRSVCQEGDVPAFVD